MRRYIDISGDILFRRYNEESWSLEIEITPHDIVTLFMEMALIEYKLTNSLTIKSKKSSEYVLLTMVDDISNIQYQNGKFRVALSSNDIGVIAAYVLQYYRDHYAPVDHIDIEMNHDGSLGKDAVLIIRASHAAEPISGEEAKKLLGIHDDKPQNR